MSTATSDAAATATGTNLSGKYLTFTLGRESYAVDVRKVREIIRMTSITAVPQMPAYIRGVINLRGKIIPVVDLRIQFGLAHTDVTDHTCVVVVQIQSASLGRRDTGLIVDGVEEVLNVAATDIEPTPDFGTQLDTRYLLGMAKLKGAVKMLLDLDRVLGGDDLPILPATAA
jgi:purine-binding chemotaxis protein CheW